MNKRIAALAAVGLLTGCGAATQAAPAPAHQGSGYADTEAIVQCYRAHGDPGFPDPVYDPGDGGWHFAASPGTAPQRTRQACQHLFPQATASAPVPQAEFRQLVRLAECIRRHGVAAWPDPNPLGEFPLPPSLQTKTPATANALDACRQFIPSGGIDAIAASS